VFNPPAGTDAKITQVVAERMRGLDFYVETLEDEFLLGLETPLAKLVTKTGFTEASADAALEIGERRVLALGLDWFCYGSLGRRRGLEGLMMNRRRALEIEELEEHKLTHRY
jgi:hypothetical protein